MTSSIPQPRRRWLLRIGVPLLLLAAIAGILLAAAWRTIVPAPHVQVAAALLRDVETDVADTSSDDLIVIQAPGWVEAEPFSVYAGALAQGVVEDVLVLEGDHVIKGQPVAKLVDDDARINLQEQEALLRGAEASLRDSYAAADVQAAMIESARAATDALIDEYERKETLVDSGAVAAGQVARLKLRIDAAKADIRKLEAQQLAAQAAVDLAQSAVATAQARRDMATLTLDRMTIVSPIDGIVIERLTSPGSVLRFGNGEHASHVVHLYDPTRLQVRADIPLADVAMVGAGQRAEIAVDLLPDHVFSGEVLRFVHRADLQKNTVEAKVRIDEPSPLLKPDMLARVRILPAPASGDSERVLVSRVFVPEASLIDGQVWIVDAPQDGLGTATRRSVATGSTTHEGWVELLDGVNPGEIVVLDPSTVSEGQRVRISKGGAQ
ncbi:MAG: efflux RND transporter periplasmic adaptor subunit [Phycisphaerales bacterium]|nr:efflux RND transporter periplasmic adaptor subunit [Phycisphaerales bacterium]